MLLLDESKSSTAAPHAGTTPVYLRLPADGQLVELPVGKTTVGSSPRCDVRIEGPGVQPVHCVIVRVAESVTVRRWGADAKLNGEAFDEASLLFGDSLTLGEVELELYSDSLPDATVGFSEDDTALAEVENSAGETSDFDQPVEESALPLLSEETNEPAFEVSTTDVSGGLGLSANSAEFVFRELQSACAISRGRSRKLLEALREKRDQCRVLNEQLADAARELNEVQRKCAYWEQSQQELQEQFQEQWRTQSCEWERQANELRRQMSELENLLADHAWQMSKLQTALAAVQGITTARTSEGDAPAGQATVCESAGVLAKLEMAGGLAGEIQPSACVERPYEATTSSSNDGEPQTSDALYDADQDITIESHAETDAERPGANDGEASESACSMEDNTFAHEPSPGDLTVDGPCVPPSTEGEDAVPFVADAQPMPSEETTESSFSLSHVGELPGTVADEAASAEISDEKSSDLRPTSFIERCAGLFAEETPTAPSLTPMSSPAIVDAVAADRRTPDVVHSAVASVVEPSNDDEESIEQYMARLLQRLRGDSVVDTTLTAAAHRPSPKPNALPAPITTTSPAIVEAAEPVELAGNPEAEEEFVEVPVNWDAIARRAAAAAPTTDLEALRALANESARRAIGRHRLKMHRRDAATKVIVSTLAGMTSLWLMLEAPNLRDIQFIAACVALVAAAYWAGEAFREMLESFRAGAYRGPDAKANAASDTDLPIDVEPRPLDK